MPVVIQTMGSSVANLYMLSQTDRRVYQAIVNGMVEKECLILVGDLCANHEMCIHTVAMTTVDGIPWYAFVLVRKEDR